MALNSTLPPDLPGGIFFLWDSVTGGHCRLIGHGGALSLSLAARKSGKRRKFCSSNRRGEREIALTPPHNNHHLLKQCEALKKKIKSQTGMELEITCRSVAGGMWPRLHSTGC